MIVFELGSELCSSALVFAFFVSCSSITTDEEHVGVVCVKCREYIAVYQSTYKEAYTELKKERGACVDCGEADIRVLEFDHADRTNKEKIVSACRSVGDLMTEASKCVIRCGICHVRRTKTQLQFGNPAQQRREDIQNRQKIAQERKLLTGCQVCGWVDVELVEALQFHHTNPEEKVRNVSQYWLFDSDEEFVAEMEKCEILCVNYHKRTTLEQNEKKN